VLKISGNTIPFSYLCSHYAIFLFATGLNCPLNTGSFDTGKKSAIMPVLIVTQSVLRGVAISLQEF
jgi:hypothetical protein